METLLEALRALEREDLETLEELLEAHPGLAGARDGAGTSLVLHAVFRRAGRALPLLLAREPALDLHAAAALGRTERVAELLDAGEPLDRPTADGFPALHLACYFGHPATARLLLERGADPAAPAPHPTRVAPLASAVAGGHREVAELLLGRGAPASPRQAGGFTPLHAASQRGDRELCELLLARGADAGERADDGTDAAGFATRGGHALLAAELAARAGE